MPNLSNLEGSLIMEFSAIIENNMKIFKSMLTQ